jgi:hypothetical protein
MISISKFLSAFITSSPGRRHSSNPPYPRSKLGAPHTARKAPEGMRTLLIAIGACLLLSADNEAGEPASGSVGEVGALKAEIDRLRSITPSQSHAMIDVEYHFANLWFAARARNWSLANFYMSETRARVQWMLRIQPVRKLASGQDINARH